MRQRTRQLPMPRVISRLRMASPNTNGWSLRSRLRGIRNSFRKRLDWAMRRRWTMLLNSDESLCHAVDWRAWIKRNLLVETWQNSKETRSGWGLDLREKKLRLRNGIPRNQDYQMNYFSWRLNSCKAADDRKSGYRKWKAFSTDFAYGTSQLFVYLIKHQPSSPISL